MFIAEKGRNTPRHKCFSATGQQFDNTIDLHAVLKDQENNKKISATTASIVKSSLEVTSIGTWLPMAAEKYKISPKLEDYVCVPVVIMPSDLPNRNGIAFPYRELVAFNPNPYTKSIAYQSWEAAPTFYEHSNSDYTQAKGVVFAVTMVPIKNSAGDLYKVVCLCGFDRTKDANLYTRIQKKELSTYSMGAYVGNYLCSICGKGYDEGGCRHVSVKDPTYRTFETEHGPKLAYYEAVEVCGFEVSAVETPAYVSAQNEHLLSLE